MMNKKRQHSIIIGALAFLLCSVGVYLGGAIGMWLYELNGGVTFTMRQFLNGFGLVGHATLVFCAPSIVLICAFSILKHESILKTSLHATASGFLLGGLLWIVSMFIKPYGIGFGWLTVLAGAICFVITLGISLTIAKGKTQNKKMQDISA
jgi:hypothetical protein